MKPSEILSSRDRAETKFYLICNNHSLLYWSSAPKAGAYNPIQTQSVEGPGSAPSHLCMQADPSSLHTPQLMTSAELKEFNTCYLFRTPSHVQLNENTAPTTQKCY